VAKRTDNRFVFISTSQHGPNVQQHPNRPQPSACLPASESRSRHPPDLPANSKATHSQCSSQPVKAAAARVRGEDRRQRGTANANHGEPNDASGRVHGCQSVEEAGSLAQQQPEGGGSRAGGGQWQQVQRGSCGGPAATVRWGGGPTTATTAKWLPPEWLGLEPAAARGRSQQRRRLGGGGRETAVPWGAAEQQL